MKKIILFSFVLSFSLVFSQTYCAGDQISEADQNLIHVVGAGDDEVTSFSTLQKAINQHVAGEEIEIRFLRGKKLMKAKVRLGRLKDN